MTQIIEAVFNGKVFEPSSTVNLKPNTKVKIIIEEENQEINDQSYSFQKTVKNLKIDAPSDFSNRKNKQNLNKLSNYLLLPEIDNDELFIRDKDCGRDIDL